MNRRNWLALSRLLVSRFDFDFTMNAIQQAIANQALSYWGEGVLPTTFYPNPFQFTMSGSVLGGSVSGGVAYDANGQLTEIGASPDEPVTFTLAAADPVHERFDLVCIEYVAVGDTPVPKPSDPILTVFLNLHDDFNLVVVTGTPGVTPVYPAKGNALYIVLAGIKVPAGATLGTQCTVDYSQRESGGAAIVGAPVFRQETPSGVVNGTNTQFTLSQVPLNIQSVMVMLDDLVLSNTQFSIVGQTITYSEAPAVGQTPYVYYIANSSTGQNPLSGAQEVPSGTVNGSNATFTLAGKAVDQNSTLVFIDGLAIPITGWSLVQGSNISSVVFEPSFIPQTGQSVYVWYLVNAATYGGAARTLTPETLYFTLSPTDISNGYVTLGHNPANPTATLCDIVGNTSQLYSTDFTVTGNQLMWTGLGMQSILFSGSQLRVSYLY